MDIIIQFLLENSKHFEKYYANSDKIDKKKVAYFCGDYISSALDTELKNEGFQVNKIINYISDKITDLNGENNKIINNHPPDIIFYLLKRMLEAY